MRTYVQLPLDATNTERAQLERRHFHSYVHNHADPDHDHVILLEPDAVLVDEMKRLWSGWQAHRVMWGWFDAGGGTLWRPSELPSGHAPVTADRASLHRRYPNVLLTEVVTPTVQLSEIFDSVPESDNPYTLAIDASLRGIDLTMLPYPPGVDEVLMTWTEDEHSEGVARHISALFRRRGLRLAGRPWGQAGSSLRMVRPHGAAAALSAMSAQAKAQAGHAVVWVRDSVFSSARREQVLQPVKILLDPSLDRRDVLDRAPGRALVQPALRDVEERLPLDLTTRDVSRTFSVSVSDDPQTLIEECWNRHGVWPISFSYPRPFFPVTPSPGRIVAPITPGIPYSFTDEEAYRATYADAIWGVTHRKAGWDCFRHMEILGAGATPLMLDAARIPRFAMTHYPKTALARLSEYQQKEPGAIPDLATRQALRDYASTYLTSKAMARYLLHAAGIGDADSVLFVDQVLPHQVDYQSVLTLVGLKQLMGRRCHVLHPVGYIYTDTKVATTDLFGRGFGFTRTLDREVESDTERGRTRPLADYDAIVVGSIARNEELATGLLTDFPAERTIWIHGEDLPPSVIEVATYRRHGVHAFVRAIHTTR